ncbi:MAG TPA: TetR/AcrR family transcriptional regulator [Gaiellaceae bacterium]|jgi:AcrR family transcriptional regulator|nr:TetR/AcrR family transcriptional regulator [Gaiellaceae bacterium]
MSATRARMAAEERRQCVIGAACRVFAKSSYSGATTAEIARECGVSEPVLYRHFSSKRDLYLACLDAAWAHVRRLWEDALAGEPDPRLQLGAMGRAYIHQQRVGDRIMLSDLWVQALNEATDDPKIRRYLRDQVREVHDFVADKIRAAQDAGGILKGRDADAEAWIFISLGLLSTIDRRLGTVGDHDFEGVFASRRRWMTGVEST